MATHTAARIKHATLTANTVDTVTLDMRSRVEVLNRGTTAPLFFRVDGLAPLVAGDECFVVMPQGSLTVEAYGAGPIVVKLISTAGNDYSVGGLG